MNKTFLLAGVSALLLSISACENDADVTETTVTEPAAPEASPAPEEIAPMISTVADALSGDWRSDADKARDAFRNPVETLEFFELAPDETVIEIWPGGGWYTSILAPYLKASGTYIAAGFDPETSEYAQRGMAKFEENFVSKPEIFGDITVTRLGPETGPLAEAGTVDTVLTFRNVHNWMSNGFADKVFTDSFAALKPGGILGVVEHRLPSSEKQNPKGGSGYVHEDYVKQLAADAGFEFVASSEINANPKDTADHPFGVWTLPPNSRSTDRDGNTPEGFDPQVYLDIGESDRMTLKFRKPVDDTPTE